MLMRPPDLFQMAINALNGEHEFEPNVIPARRLMKCACIFCARLGKSGLCAACLGTGMEIETFMPYWYRLRDEAWRIGQLRTALSHRPAYVPADSVYRNAQDVFVQTLRNLVGKWCQSDWSLRDCFEKHPKIRWQIAEFLRRDPLMIVPAKAGPSQVVRATQRFPRRRDNPQARARREATVLFIDLIRHPAGERLRMCLRCKRYFFGRPDQKCCPRPRRCGSYRAAIKSTKERWHKKRKEKLYAAREAIAEWHPGSGKPWKTFVAERVGKTEKWVTRAVNCGELTVPLGMIEANLGGRPPKKGKHNAN